MNQENVDKRNTKRMRAIIALHGWPLKSMVGSDGMRSAWLLVQHADHDVVFQRACLKLIEQAAKNGQAHNSDVAYLTDRVLVNEGKPQLYGTQFHVVKGVRQPRPLHDPENVDRRRKSMDLSTIKEYTEFMHT